MKQAKEYLGSIPLPILEYLERKYPEVIPSPKDSIESIMYRSGARQVVKHLLETYDPRGRRHE